MGFPGQGLDAARSRLASRPGAASSASMSAPTRTAPIAPPTTSSAAAALAPYADYLVCNVSSPNTPGLRNLQGRVQLADLLKRVQDAIAGKPVPLLVKIAPDATDDDLDDIVAVCRELRMDGIMSATRRLSRPPTLHSARRDETGGLSGAPLTALSTEVLRRTAQRVEKQFPLVGCGGVGSGADAYAKIRAGATPGAALLGDGLSTDRRSSAASRTSSRRCWPATASRPVAEAVGSDL